MQKPVETSRRGLIRTGAGLLAGGAAAGLAPRSASAQEFATAGDAQLGRVQARRRLLLKGGIVLTLDRQIGDFASADILIEDGKIREVRPDIATGDDAEVIDASEHIIIPGFIDTHSHSFEGQLRSSLPNGTIFDPGYRETFEVNLIGSYEPADVYAGVLVTALGMIAMGTTGVVDTSQINHTPEHTDALVRAFQEAGIRAVCAYSPGRGPGSQYPQDVGRLRRAYFNSDDQLLTLALGTSRNPKLWAYARETGLRSVMHIRLNSDELVALGRAGLSAAWRRVRFTARISTTRPGA